MAGKSKAKIGYVGVLLLSMLSIRMGHFMADSYIDRLPDHRGFHLVAVENQVTRQPLQKPRRLVLVVVDGLREDHARSMNSAKRLAKLGQCRSTWTGPVTISRPVYTVISTGLEQDRTGSRNNDDTSPVAVESIWQVAKKAGIPVHAASNLEWWRQLFPGAFSSYRFDLDEEQNFFVLDELTELSLIHPLRVDTAGHKFGAASAEYQEAVDLVDQELSALLDKLDLEQDLLILTSDHGHSAPGGHGGTTLEIAQVLTCYAGVTIAHDKVDVRSDSRIIAPTISVLLGLPFPKHMRATDDKLDQIWSIVRDELLGTAYVQERKASIARFRDQNAVRVGALMSEDRAGWDDLYERETRRHRYWWIFVAGLLAIGFVAAGRLRRQSAIQVWASLLWSAGTLTLICLLYTWLRGSFDFTSINTRLEFRDAALGASLSVGLLAAAGHYALWRDLRRLAFDNTSLLAGLVVVSLAHPLIYGFTLGFPLPGRVAIFLPFILGALVISAGLLNLLLLALLFLQRWLQGQRSA